MINMAQNSISTEQLAAVLEALVPAQSEKIREVLGISRATGKTGFVFITESEREWYPEELTKLAEEACSVWSNPDFSVKTWRKAAREGVRRLREAHPETALAFLLRKGVQTLANDWYQTIPREWQEYAATVQSNNYAEWHNPLYGSVIAQRVDRGGKFAEGRIVGEDNVLVNYKFGLIEAFDRELFDDDQTGQIRRRASNLGASMAICENAYAAIRFIGAAGSYANLSVPASNYTTTDVAGAAVTTPWSTTLYGATAGDGNRPVAYSALSLIGLKTGWTRLLNAKDPLSNKIITNPNTLVVSAFDALHAPLLVKPPQGVPYYPAPIGLSGEQASSATSGAPGGAFGANPFMGLGINPVVVRFLADWAWALGEKGKGFVFQERDPLEVVQEAGNSGAAFETDALRYRSRRRFEADWVGGGSRFWYLGNDGTVSGSF